MATSAQEPITLGISAPAPTSESFSSSVSSTPFSRRSSRSSDQRSVSSINSTELAAVGSQNASLGSTNPKGRGPRPRRTEDSSFTMARRSTSVGDESDLSNRRSSGRARKLTSKYQALTGTKLLPVDSANHASEDATMIAEESSPNDSLAASVETAQASTSKVQSPLLASPTSTEPTPSIIKKGPQKAHPVLSHDIEETGSRSLRRERKPSAKFLEATAAQTPPKSPPSPTKDSARLKALRSARRSSVSTAEDTAPHEEAGKTREQSAPTADVVVPSDPDRISRLLSRSPTKEFHRTQLAPASRMHLDSPKPSNPPAATIVLKRSASPADDDSLLQRASALDENPFSAAAIDALYEFFAEASIPSKPGVDRSNSRIASSSRKRSGPPTKESSQPKILRLSLKPPKRPSNLRFSVSSTENVVDIQSGTPTETNSIGVRKEQLGNKSREKAVNLSSAPARVQHRRPSPNLAVGTKRSDSFVPEIQRNRPGKTQDKSGEAGCNLFCLSPSSRILAFAQIAAESSDSDDENEGRDEFDAARPASRDLYEKWMAIGRKRFCVCNTPADDHSHPSGTRHPTSKFEPVAVPNGAKQTNTSDAALPELPQDASLAFPIPPVNSIMPASEGRKVSALYNALTDTQMPLGPIRRSPIDFSTPPPSESVHPMTFEQRMREDFRALEAIRQQAAREGIQVRYDMNYDQIKAHLDEHRIKASNDTVHTYGRVRGKGVDF